MPETRLIAACVIYLLSVHTAAAQIDKLRPVTDDMLEHPDPADWLMYSRTYDNHRFSPLAQITRETVDQLRLVWSGEMYPGTQETIPLVHQGVMFIAHPGGIIQARDAAAGDVHWEYKRKLPDDIGDYMQAVGRNRVLALYQDMLYYASPDGFLLALDVRTGKLRWETEVYDYHSGTQHSTGPFVAKGRVYTGRNCGDTREFCFIAAHDAVDGRELWRFHTTAAAGEPGGDTWGEMPDDIRLASPWGLPGGYDPVRDIIYWGTANPSPHTRIKRHNGKPFAVPLEAPAELYSNSTLALDAATGELKWYYQHLPGDDWDSDHTHERILVRTRIEPDNGYVKWINPNVERGEVRDVVVSVGEPGGLWVLGREDGQFLWATPFPFDTPDFHIAGIDVETGRTRIARNKVLTREGETHLTCFQNTRSYWPMAYNPENNSLYVPYHDACVERTGRLGIANGHARITMRRPGSDPEAFAGLARIDMATGEIDRLHTQRNPGNGAILLTAGDLMFWGDMTGTLHAFDAENGEILWEGRVDGIIQTSTITYAVNGRQYLAVLTGEGEAGTSGPLGIVEGLQPVRDHNAIYVYALPQ